MYFTDVQTRWLSLGAQILGGGGGGREYRGLKTAREAMDIGAVELVALDSLAPDDLVVTVSGVGAPSRKEAMYTSEHYLRALELIEQHVERPIAGFIPSEMGGGAAFGPFIAAAAKRVPVIDAACDGRAHPLGTMGALGLDRIPDYQTIQVACGGKRELGTYIEVVTRGTIRSASKSSLLAAELAGGLAVVVRNPVEARYLHSNAAVGCYTQAMELGEAVDKAESAINKAEAAAKVLGGQVICQGEVVSYDLTTVGGLDQGRCVISDGRAAYELSFYNEYMTVQQGGARRYTFPDLIATLDAETGAVVLTADMGVGRRVILVTVPRDRLLLSSGLRQATDYQSIEKVIGLPMLPYLKDIVDD